MRVKKTIDAQPVNWRAVAQDEPKSVNLDAPFKFNDERDRKSKRLNSSH